MKDTNFTHAIQVDTDTCIGCSHCMKVCPTKAIRISEGHAAISSERCVDCGECFRVCPAHAIYVEADSLSMIRDYDYRVALIPSVFIGQFPSEFSTSQVLSAVHQLGFHEVFEVEQAVDFIKEEYREISEKAKHMQPVISSYCPAVVRMIQVLFPSLTQHILQLKAPHDLAALFLRNDKEKGGGKTRRPGLFYVTPCASKIVAAKAPEGESESPIDGVINMNELYNKVYHILMNGRDGECLKQYANMSSDAVNWSLSGTEKKYFNGRSLAIDGVGNVIEFLEKLETGQISDIDFLELRACDQGCAGGILCPGNRFLTVERLEEREKCLQDMIDRHEVLDNKLMAYREELKTMSRTNPILPRAGIFLDNDMGEALRKMDKIKTLRSYLPGFDCGACGSPSCKTLAEDIVKGRASMSYCVFVQRVMEKNYKLSPEKAFQLIEKIWGKNRLNKYNDSDEKVES